MDEDIYKKLLDKTYEELPETVFEKNRFEIPKVKGKIIKSITTITNFKDILKTLDRDSEHLSKYILKEVGVRGKILDNGFLSLFTKANPAFLNTILEKYFNQFVKCSNCLSPDTKLENNKIVCSACGHIRNTKLK